MTDGPQRLSTEMAHVLYMDMVGFSLLPMEEQTHQIEELRALVRQIREFQRGVASGELLTVDTGDGMALVYFRDPTAPVECAVELAQALSSRPHLQVRMGVNSGPVTRVTDISGNQNVSGGGIIQAQRVMDCGDGGHILLSQSTADVMRQFANWEKSIVDLGEFEVKHGTRLRVYNLCLNDVGNPTLPHKLHSSFSVASTMHSATLPAFTPEASHSANVSAHPQVAVLYKRNAPHMNHLLDLLERQLTEAGYSLFIDRHLPVGVQWGQEIRRQMRSSYAIIPLLSAESIWSEMVEDEIQTAHEAAQSQGGHPRLLPVRVNYEGPLPEPLAHILNPIQYTLWQSEEDDAHLVEELLRSLHTPQAARTVARDKLEAVGGAVPLDSRFYVVRPTDEEFKTAIARRDSIVLVKGARQMGKTSLLARGLQQARQAGAKCVLTDFQKLNVSHLETIETLFLTLAEMIADQFDLDVMPDEVWNPKRGANVNFERYLRREVLGKIEGNVVWALDEVDRLFACTYGSEVFGLFRSWYNERALDPDGPWSRLTLAIAYATEAHLFITDVNQSPFNVGTRLTLNDFERQHVVQLNSAYDNPLRSEDEITRFHVLVGGQPYLVRRGMDQMAANGLTYAELESQADLDEGVFGDHLRRLLVSLSQDVDVLAIVRRILRGEPLGSAADFYRLRSGGLLSGASEHEYRMRCQLYTRYLERHLL